MAKSPTVSLTDALEALSEVKTSEDIVALSPEQIEATGKPRAREDTMPSKLPELISSDRRECNFDFGNMPQSIVVKVKSLHRGVYDKVHDAIIGIGEDLLRMKRLIDKHGDKGAWSRYLSSGLPIKERSARHYMAAAETRALLGPSATVAEKLPLTVLYKMPKAPGEVVEEVVRRVEANESVNMKTFNELLNANASAQSAAVPTAPPVKASEHADTTVMGLDGDRAGEEDVNQQRASTVAAAEAVQPSVAAALELIAQLREHYNDQEIIKLDDLWQTAGPGALRRRLTSQ